MEKIQLAKDEEVLVTDLYLLSYNPSLLSAQLLKLKLI
jgi:hypothetical protein